MRFTVSLLSILSFAACNTASSSEESSLAKRCAIAVAIEKTATGAPGDPPPLPDSPDDCPVCRDADGHALPPDKCVAHDYVCKNEPAESAALPPLVDRELAVITPAADSPAIAYYGACDGGGGTCEQRDFAYSLYGNEVAVATFSNHQTHVFAIPEVSPGVRVAAVRAHQPVFPLLEMSATYYNDQVEVTFVNDAGETVTAGGDVQNDCRVTADAGGTIDPNPAVPCWCTQC